MESLAESQQDQALDHLREVEEGAYEKKPDCETCGDTKEVTKETYDHDSHRYVPDDVEPCPDCTITKSTIEREDD